MKDKQEGRIRSTQPSNQSVPRDSVPQSESEYVFVRSDYLDSEPAIQNISVRTEIARSIVSLFQPPPGATVLTDADYSQIELRVVARLGGLPDAKPKERE